MRFRLAMGACAVALLGAFPAAAQAVPEFLADGARFVRNTDLCNPPENSEFEGTLEITEAGIFGYELGCPFLSFLPDIDRETREVHGWVAISNCGDDSGITRPDSFTLIFDEYAGSLTVQSQNEYALGEALSRMPRENGGESDPFEAASWLSGDYVICPKS
jgi:hypothetical protein